MGAGVGKFEKVLAPIRAGEVFVQIRSDYPMAVIHAYRNVKHSFPMKTKLLCEEYQGDVRKRFAPVNRQVIQQYTLRTRTKKASSKTLSGTAKK